MGPKLVWNVPYPRNPFFTGREKLLSRLRTQFQAGQAAVLSHPQAISGLGGIGKTQIAVQYAYQHRDDYQAVLWARAESRETLTSSFVEIAALLDLPQKRPYSDSERASLAISASHLGIPPTGRESKDAQDLTVTVKAVKHWLQANSGWLLILDNADEPATVREFLPTKFDGHILLTTRAQALGGLAQGIEVDTFTAEMGALFLLRHATLIAPDATLELATLRDREIAMQISDELGGLPLALDQAGAYIEQAHCSLSDYRSLYRTRRSEMLKERGNLVDGGPEPDYPETVATTWSISFQKLEQKSPVAAELLRLCAFLAPDAIPEEIITKGTEHLGSLLQTAARDPIALNKAIAALVTYYLIHRNATEKTLSIHRLVQAVLKDAMSEDEAKLWVERTVCAVNAAFPDVEFAQWSVCERCLPHALLCADLIEREHLMFVEAARLLNQAGDYLHKRARYSEAEPLLKHALAIREQQLGPEYPDTAQSLSNLAELYHTQGKYEQAEPLYQRAIAIREKQLGSEHPDTAHSLNSLAALYWAQGKFEQAESLLKRALRIYEQQLGLPHPDTAFCLNNLAALYYHQGKYEQAEPLHLRALEIREKQLGPEHPDTALSLDYLASLYRDQGKYEQAEPLILRAFSINEKALPEHPEVADNLNNLALLYQAQGKFKLVEPLYVRALSINEKALGPEHPHTANSLNSLAELYRSQGKYEQAEPLYVRALSINEKALGLDHPFTASSLNNLALLYHDQGKYEQAELLYVCAHVA